MLRSRVISNAFGTARGVTMFLVVDCETNGLPRSWKAPVTDLSNWPRAVQVAWALYDSQHRQIVAASRIVRPDGFSIPPSAVQVHGISTERALAEGRPILDVLGELSAAAAQAQIFVAHNAGFDGSVIAAEYFAWGISRPLARRPWFVRWSRVPTTVACPGLTATSGRSSRSCTESSSARPLVVPTMRGWTSPRAHAASSS